MCCKGACMQFILLCVGAQSDVFGINDVAEEPGSNLIFKRLRIFSAVCVVLGANSRGRYDTRCPRDQSRYEKLF